MIKRYPRYCGILIGLVSMMAAGLFCDDGTGSICGKVQRPNGKPAKKADVILFSGVGNYPDPLGIIKTDKNGAFCFTALKAGDFIVDANYFTRFDFYYCRKELVLKEGTRQSVELILEKRLLHGCGKSMISIDESMLTHVFTKEDLESTPTGSGGGR